jgi:hypothetical protein
MSIWLLVSSLDVLSIGLPFCFVASPLPSFRNQFVFNSTLMKDFGKLLGSSSLSALRPFLFVDKWFSPFLVGA